jgi:hypothetical protein
VYVKEVNDKIKSKAIEKKNKEDEKKKKKNDYNNMNNSNKTNVYVQSMRLIDDG